MSQFRVDNVVKINKLEINHTQLSSDRNSNRNVAKIDTLLIFYLKIHCDYSTRYLVLRNKFGKYYNRVVQMMTTVCSHGSKQN